VPQPGECRKMIWRRLQKAAARQAAGEAKSAARKFSRAYAEAAGGGVRCAAAVKVRARHARVSASHKEACRRRAMAAARIFSKRGAAYALRARCRSC